MLTHSRDTGKEPTTGREEELRLKALSLNIPRVCSRAGQVLPAGQGSVIGVPQLEGGSEEGPGGESGKDRNLQVLYVFS